MHCLCTTIAGNTEGGKSSVVLGKYCCASPFPLFNGAALVDFSIVVVSIDAYLAFCKEMREA